MADEEVDWGVEDVLSLGGEDGEYCFPLPRSVQAVVRRPQILISYAATPAPTSTAANMNVSSEKQPATNGQKVPPTGPRKSVDQASRASQPPFLIRPRRPILDVHDLTDYL